MSERIITKQCPKCKKTYPATTEYFHRSKVEKFGLRTYCKKCRRQYYQQHKEEIKKKRKRYHQTHRIERQQYDKQYNESLRGYLYRVWCNMLQRCNNPKIQAYKYYGARGIEVKFACFDNFRDYILNELKVDPRGLTIDRIDNNGHYEKGNIRFVTQAENNRNKRKRK